jgi:hypothetical protein
MANITIKGTIPSNGNPEGLVAADVGALFYKSGSFYKINYVGMSSSLWQNVVFDPFGKNRIFVTEEDLASIPTASNESMIYVKDTESSSFGWKFLTSGDIMYNS